MNRETDWCDGKLSAERLAVDVNAIRISERGDLIADKITGHIDALEARNRKLVEARRSALTEYNGFRQMSPGTAHALRAAIEENDDGDSPAKR